MAATTNLNEIVIVDELLTQTNYQEWKVHMKNNLIAQDLWCIVDGSDSKPHLSLLKDSSSWTIRNERALQTIRMSCGPQMLPEISGCVDAKEAWDKLALVTGASMEEKDASDNQAAEAATNQLRILMVDELLSSSNYKNWKSNMVNILSAEDLWSVVGPTACQPPPEQAHEFPNWKMANGKALEIIRMSCISEMEPHLRYADCFIVAWEQLEFAATADAKEQERYRKMLEEAEAAKWILNGVAEADKILTPSNYKNWAIFMTSLLKSRYLWGIVDGSEDSTASISGIRSRKNSEALKDINNKCGPEMRFFGDAVDAKEAWDQLKDACEAGDAYIKYLPLVQAIQNDDYEKYAEKFKSEPEATSARITEDGSTALHVAIGFGRINIAKSLLNLMTPKQLEIKTGQGNTALSVAAEGNNLELVEIMVKKHRKLLVMKDGSGHIPLVTSAINGDEDVLRYLYSETNIDDINSDEIGDTNMSTLMTAALRVDLFDVTLELLKKFPKYAITKDEYGMTVFNVLAGKPSAFPSGDHFGFWYNRIYQSVGAPEVGLVWRAFVKIIPAVKHIHEKTVRHGQADEIVKIICPLLFKLSANQLEEAGAWEAIHLTTIHGIVEFFTMLMNHPNLIQFIDESGRSLFQNSVIHRQESIFELISQMGPRNQSTTIVDKSNNNILHCAGFWRPSTKLNRVSGEALQMQRELQWYQEVERVVKLRYREMKNDMGLKPKELFTKEHKNLVKEGAAWMKETAQACMVVSTLIATVVFAAAFTVPGGNNQNTGLPMFLGSAAFTVFIIADAISLFASCTSVLVFFSLLIARYAEQDFLISLPRKLIIGLSSLFISIATMIAAFAATLVIALRQEVSWVYIPVAVLASIPVVLFGFFQLPLFVDIVKSTYWPGLFQKKKISIEKIYH